MGGLRKKVGVIIALIVVALSGLVVLQSYLLNFAMQQKEQAFRRNVMAALHSAAQRLETQEAVEGVMRVGSICATPRDSGLVTIQVVTYNSDSAFNDSMMWVTEDTVGTRAIRIADNFVHYSVPSRQRVFMQAYDIKAGTNTVVLDTIQTAGIYQKKFLDDRFAEGLYMFRFKTDSASAMFEIQDGRLRNLVSEDVAHNNKQELVRRIVDGLVVNEASPVEDRLEPGALDSVISLSLTEAGIDLEYAFGVLTRPDDSLRIAQPATYAEQLRTSEFKTRLFPLDIFAARSDLALFFPKREAYLWRQIGPLLVATLVLMLIIIGCFTYTVRTIIVQKRLAGRMTGFINNMTHEFKTPISTITLASEAIERPDVRVQPDKVERYNQMIQHENLRMRGQVEKILQMAVLEEGDYELELGDVDVHDVVTKAVNSIALQITKRRGTITSALNAERHVVRADAVHLTNIIHNLLDNANKYSPEAPVITVSTKNENNGVLIRVNDRGTGIGDQDKEAVFDKYYRVPTGNIHDVKGFGLGLSYVKLMTAAHGGTVALTSEPGKGTQVELYFPFDGRAS